MTLAIFDITALELLSSVIFWTYMVAAVCVIIGVYWEKESFSQETRHKGWILLLGALGVETALTIGLHAVDDEISSRQRATIASQQRTIEQLLRPRRLTSEQKERIAAAVAPFRLPFVVMTSHDAETWDFAMEMAATLKANGWNWLPFPGGGIQPMDGRPSAGVTIVDHIEIQGPPERAALVNALVAAIKEPGIIGMADVRPFINPNVKIMTIIAGTKR